MDGKKVGNAFIVIALIGVAFLAGLLINQFVLTGQVVSEVESFENNSIYHWTKAICDNDNRCIDVKITCEGSRVLSVDPVSSLTEFGDNWEHPRIENADKLCD